MDNPLSELVQNQPYEEVDATNVVDVADSTKERISQKDLALRLAMHHEYWHDVEGDGYATIQVSDHVEHHKIRSKSFRDLIRRDYYVTYGKSLGSQALEDAVGTVEGKAKFDGKCYEPGLRVAKHGNNIYLDLCNDEWQAVEISTSGWSILATSPVKFIRKKGMLALPNPVQGGVQDLEALRELLNLTDNNSWILLLAFLVGVFMTEGAYPILIVVAEQGSGKSFLCRVIRSLVDPSVAPLRSPPREEGDLIIAAQSSRIVVYDNLSGTSRDLSDWLCRLSTGGGMSKRQLYTDGDEVLFNVQRPVVLNGIDDLATRQDLIDRALIINLPTITELSRKAEKEINEQLEAMRPAVLGALLNAVSTAMRNQGNVQLGKLPRMADFTIWVSGAESALGIEPGHFMQAYETNRRDAISVGLESSVLGQILPLVAPFAGTPAKLHQLVAAMATDEQKRSRRLPANAKVMSDQIRRLAPAFRQVGIKITQNKSNGQRWIEIREE